MRLHFLVLLILCFLAQSQDDESPKGALNTSQVIGGIRFVAINPYRFERSSTISDKFFKIKEVHPIDNLNISVIAQQAEASNKTVVNQYSGRDFGAKLSSKTISGQESIKLSSKKLYINRKNCISQELIKGIFMTLNTSSFWNKAIIKDGYFYDENFKKAQQKLKCNSLWRVNIETGVEELINYQSMDFCNYITGQQPLIADVGGKYIVYIRRAAFEGVYDLIYMINTQTAKTEYEFKSSSRGRQYLGIRNKLQHWHNSHTNQSIINIFGGYGQNYFLESFLFNNTSQEYEPSAYVTGSSANCYKFTQTAFDQNVCLKYNSLGKSIQHYDRLPSFTVLYRSNFTQNDQKFIGRTFLLTSANQSLLVMFHQSYQRLEVFSIDESTPDFSTQQLFYIQIQQNLTACSLTSDDQKLFLFTADSSNKHFLTVYDFNQQTIIAQIHEQLQATHLAFLLFNSASDRFIILARKKANQSSNNFTHHLQIRQISSPENLIQEVALPFLDNVTSFGYSLKANNSSELNFLIIIKLSMNESDYKSLSFLCSIKNDNLSLLVNGSSDLSYRYTFFGSQYIISYLRYQRTNVEVIQVYDKRNLSLLKEIPSQQQPSWGQVVFKYDTLWACTDDGNFLYRIELSKSIGDPGFGKFTKFYDNSYQLSFRLIFFKTKGFILKYNFEKKYKNQTYKIVLNASLPIDQISPPIKFYLTAQNPYIPKNRNSNLKCDTFVFRQTGDQNSFSSLRNCDPFDPPAKYSVRKQGDPANITNFWVYGTSTNHHVLTQALIPQKNITRIQLRSVNREYQILWEKEFPNDTFYGGIRWMDFTKEGVLMFKGYSQNNYTGPKVVLTSPEILHSAQNYEFQSFIEFSINELGSIAFVGENVLSTPQKPIISITVIDKNKATLSHRNILFSNTIPFAQEKIKGITIDELNSKAVFCYETSPDNITLLAWEFLSPYERILDLQVVGEKINKLQFIGSDRLLFDLDGQIRIVELDFSKTHKFKSFLHDFPSSQLYTFSKDGSLFAFLSGKNLDIYDQNQTIVGQIELKLQSTQIQAMSFGINNTLYLIDSNSTVSIFTNQLNCSRWFTNKKGFCVCLRENADQTDCKCNENYFDHENGQCQQCSFWCQECESSSTSCIKYSTGFYVIVIGGSVLLIGLIVVGRWLVIKRKRGNSKPEASDVPKAKTDNSQKSAGDLLAEDSLSEAFKKSG